MIVCLFVSLAILAKFGYCAKLNPPTYITPCHKKDPDFDKCCLREARNTVPAIIDGDKKYGVPVLDPLSLKQIVVDNGGLKIDFRDVVITGIRKAQVTEAKFDLEKRKIHLGLQLDQVEVKSKYEMSGKILVLPLEGKGDCHVNIDRPFFEVALSYHLSSRDGMDYIQLDDEGQHVSFVVKGANFKFENLFNGNNQLGTSTNHVLNDEWDKVIDELRPAISQTVVKIVTTIVNNVGSRVPYDKFFPE